MRVPAKQYRFPSNSCRYERHEAKVEVEEAARAAVHRKSEVRKVSAGVVRRVQ